MTPLCTQFSYQGQLDDYFNIEYNKILVDRAILEEDEKKKEPKKNQNKVQRMYLTPDDVVFQKIKDYTLDEARYYVSDKMRNIQSLTEELKKESSTEVLAKVAKEKKFVKKYKEHLTLAMHVQKNLQRPINFKLFEYEQNCISGGAPNKEIFNHLEQLIIFKTPIHKIYKMLIIWSISEGSIKQSYFDSLTKDIVVTYGFSEVKRIELLCREGFINIGSSGVFSGMNKSRFNTLVNVSFQVIFAEKRG